MELKLDVSLLISKAIIIILLAVAGGWWLANSEKEDSVKAKEITLEKYTANYETYKKGLEHDDPTSFLQSIVIVFIMGGAFLGFYEVMAWILAVFLKLLFGNLRKPHEVRDLLS